MNIYNANFIVKYNDIRQELLIKALSTNDYSTDDVIDICSKLYRDELMSVFNVKEIRHIAKLHDELCALYLTLKDNKTFNDMFNILKDDVSANNDLSNISQDNDIDVFALLFTEQMFHITHKCICELLTTQNISNELLNEYKTYIKKCKYVT